MRPRTDRVISEFLSEKYAKGQLNVAEVARSLGVRRKVLQEIVDGDRPFIMELLDDVAEFFGLDTPAFIHMVREEVDALPPPLLISVIRVDDDDTEPCLICHL